MTASPRTDFDVQVSPHGLGPTIPQRIGRLLWAPMLVMALMAFPLAFLLGAWRSTLVAQGGDPTLIAALGQFVPAVMFTGFAAAFAAVSFAIARILGVLRTGGGQVQETAGRSAQTLRTPWTAWAFIGLMAMAMMILLAGVVGNAVVGAAILGGDPDVLASSGTYAIAVEAVRRIGIAAYLVAVALGLATIIEVLRFQAVRVRELPTEALLHTD